MPTVIMSVYFNGTDEAKYPGRNENLEYISLASLLHEITEKNDSTHYSRCIEGCGIGSPYLKDLGGIFAYYLDDQVLKFADQVEDKLDHTIESIILNVYGFSRGGAAAFLLCQKLKHVSSERLTINVVALDPVPGNLITTVSSDIILGTHHTLSTEVADLTACKNIANLLVLFTNEPMPAIVAHAPLLPAVPTSCHAEIDVTPGCHKSAVSFLVKGNIVGACNQESTVAFWRVAFFLRRCGTEFNFLDRLIIDSSLNIGSTTKLIEASLLTLYSELRIKSLFDGKSKRLMHLGKSIFTIPHKKYLNRHHQSLSGKTEINDEESILIIKDKNPTDFNTNRTNASNFIQLALLLAIMWQLYEKFWPQEKCNEHCIQPKM